AGADLVLRQLTSPALLAVAGTEGERTRRLRIGLDPAGATLERADDDHPSRWTELAAAEVPAAVSSLLEESGIDLAHARPAGARGCVARRVAPAQNRLAYTPRAAGLPAGEAFRDLPALGASVRSAPTARGRLVSRSPALDDPRRWVTEEGVCWCRLW